MRNREICRVAAAGCGIILRSVSMGMTMKYRLETAVVEEVDGGAYVLRMSPALNEHCARCGLCSAHGADAQSRFMRVKAANVEDGVKQGDVVLVRVPAVNSAVSALVILGLPLAAGLTALGAGAALHFPDWLAVVLGAGGFAAGWALSYLVWGRKSTPTVSLMSHQDGGA